MPGSLSLCYKLLLLLCAKEYAIGWVSSHQKNFAPRHLSSTRSSSSSSSLNMGLRSGVRRVRDSILSKERTRKDLKIGIAGFYDRSSKLWEDVWGEHMHHGYYIPEDRTDHVQAQIDLIDEVLKWADVTKATSAVDVGCGIGGSSRHIARKFNCKARGITLSPYQAARGNELAIEQGVADRTSFQVADALDQPFEDNSFDLVWSLESGEHMPDKKKFVDELFRVATPGGRILIVTWCHRDLEDGETSLTKKEERILARINRAYYLPKWCSVKDYVDLLEAKGASNVRREDWSYIIAPFWKAVIKSSLNLKSVVGLMKSGFSTIRGAYAMLLMLRGFNLGVIKFGLITCTKPTN
uniref:Methyltransferase type 11 domain-containing protein n=1 Tax=Pseudo-nitzschia australis TaxID=44445 RepID=A0A7S4AWA4_9STRA|mmetsp:Transcript_25367/g.55592  ORF Transcript_25367/g.55592 Transcript_25367/m.55592 type:complete len:353 (+) Transcript_25367:72-1130(+)|eukprot:CAMPEP_0168201708 /NCGR_PEP_ID=MMETSP0139_2-20121125/23869_1 /TAXON_ID=44445 /ORGANISM="Pseudo-nitzschia australis, Strain 10249 10 AB" /LENGTH=352 /DNA_ID=CAMNT_0008127319 /DNA_START=77 /DNA_END=1135 /DNA_ORIENTATION=+